MGKVHISEELRNKLDNVLGMKTGDITSNSPSVAPAPKWSTEKNNSPPPPPPRPPPPPAPPDSPKIKTEPKQKPEKINPISYNEYIEWGKIVFFTSVVGGIGLVLGVKMGTIIFL